MTTCPGCGRLVPADALVCPSCGTAATTLPDGLFRDEAGPRPLDPQATTAFIPDFLTDELPDAVVTPVRPMTSPLTSPEEAPDLPDDLFRSETSAIRTPRSTTSPDAVRAAAPGRPIWQSSASPSTQTAWYALGVPGTPVSDLLPSERTAEGELEPVRTRSIGWVLLVLAVLLLAALIGGIVWWQSSPVPGPQASRSARAASPATTPSTAPTSVQTGSRASVTSSPAPQAAFPPRDSSPCTDRVAVNAATSCPFAQNVAAALRPMAEGATQSLTATSPTTGQTYQMTCKRTGYVTCTGGVNAVVYVKVDA